MRSLEAPTCCNSGNLEKESRLAFVFNSIRPYVEKIKNKAPWIGAAAIGLSLGESVGFLAMAVTDIDKTLLLMGSGIGGAFVGVIYRSIKRERECDNFAKQALDEATQVYSDPSFYQKNAIY